MMRQLFLTLSQSRPVETTVSRVGPVRRMTRRFVAGETRGEALHVARTLNADGLAVALDYLGESVNDPDEARAHAEEYVSLLKAIRAQGVNSDVSLKLTGMGLDVDEELCYQHVRRVVEVADRHGNSVEIDMEASPYVEATLRLYKRLLREGFRNVLVAIQAYLYRSEHDIRDLIAIGGRVRLVKGAYAEPPGVAFPQKQDVDANFVRLMRLMLGPEARATGFFAAIATHDEPMIRATLDYVSEQRIGPEAFEFQMIYGIRRRRQRELAAEGYTVRIYVPYGTHWYPYFMRRLAERPANLFFLLRHLVELPGRRPK
ncbi:MAG: proline dehydrogenase family protein [Ardenticatenia bacterium]|nr:proline dehydrogenase family protein [Ardenticatenia bacterium]